MTFLAMLFTLVVAALLQALLPTARWTGYTPVPVLMSLVLYYALMRPRSVMLQAAIGAGLIEDSMGQMPLGYTVFSYCVLALVVESVRDTVLVRQWTTHVALGALGNLAITLTTMLLLIKDGLIALHLPHLVVRAVGALILGGAVAPLVCASIDALERTLGLVEQEDHLA